MSDASPQSHRSHTEPDLTTPNQLGDAQTGDPAESARDSTSVSNARPEPSLPAGAVVCARCSTVNRADDQLCSKCKSFLPKNQLQREHGLYSKLPPPADLRERVDALRAGVIADRGGESELSTLERAYIEKLGDIEVTIRLLTQDIAVHGLLTKSGGVRGVFAQLLNGLAAFDRYAQRVGLERRAKKLSFVESITEANREAGRE